MEKLHFSSFTRSVTIAGVAFFLSAEDSLKHAVSKYRPSDAKNNPHGLSCYIATIHVNGLEKPHMLYSAGFYEQRPQAIQLSDNDEPLVSVEFCSAFGTGIYADFTEKGSVHSGVINANAIKGLAPHLTMLDAGLNLTYEYNEYVVGYVVTDKLSQRAVNFQFDPIVSNHPTPNYHVRYGCEGDDSYEAFDEKELEVITDWLRSHDDVRELEAQMTTIAYNPAADKALGELHASQGCLWENDIQEAYDRATGYNEAMPIDLDDYQDE